MADDADEESPATSAKGSDDEEVEEEERPDNAQMQLETTAALSAGIGRNKARGTASATSQSENMKDKIIKYKENRQARISSLTLMHRHIIDMVACLLNIEVQEVADGVVDADEHITYMNELFAKGKRFGLMVYYQMAEVAPLESGRYVQYTMGLKDRRERRVIVTNGLSIELKDKAVLVYKTDDKEIELRNAGEDLFFAKITLDDHNGNIVGAIFDIFQRFVAPSVKSNKDWGELSKTEAGLIIKREFIGDFDQFYNFLDTTRIDIDGIVKFNYKLDFYEEKLSTVTLMRQTTSRIDHVRYVESLARSWAKVMERVLTQFQQLRRENEFVGPAVEIEYWRRQLAKFTSIVEFLRGEICNKHLQLLIQSKSKFLKVWNIHDNMVTDAKNECQDNVKYLYALEKYWQPLYRCDPSEIPDHLPALLYAIRMVYTTSRYYNNTANVTAILVKVSNQMVQVCRRYLNCDGTKVIWRQPRAEIMNKFKICLDLYLKYYQCFKHLTITMEQEGELPFECSEVYVFGKFETFKKRIEEIIDVIETTTKYSILSSSTIEGIDEFAKLFKQFYLTISSKTYDVLNHRLEVFSKDYDEFKQNVADTEYDLEAFVGVSLDKFSDVDNILNLLAKFEKLNLECMHLDERYLEAFAIYQSEIEDVRDRYNEDRQKPPLPKYIPPVSGRIMWIRQLYRRIELPMNVFQKKHRVMRHRAAQKGIQMYNALATVFVHYEQIYHHAWFDNLYEVRHGLGSPILIRHPKTRRFIVNFDPFIMEALRESEYMYKLQLDVPDSGEILVFCKDKILESYELIKNLIRRHDSIKENIPKLFIPLMKLSLIKMENIFLPGFSKITWTSMKIPEFCADITHFLDNIEVFVKEVTDIKEARIDEIIDSISQMCLVYLPDEPQTPEDFLAANINHSKQIVVEIDQKSSTAEKAVVDLINKFMDSIVEPHLQEGKYDWLDPEKVVKPVGSSSKLIMGEDDTLFKEIDRDQHIDLSTIHADCVEMFAYFNMNITDALVKCTKSSLEKLKRRASFTTMLTAQSTPPLMKTSMELQIPLNLIIPSLEDIELHFNKVLNNILATHKEILQWGQKYAKRQQVKQLQFTTGDYFTSDGFNNIYKAISEHKEIVRVSMSLQGVIYLVQPDVKKLLHSYLAYDYLWAEDRDEQIAAYCENNPMVVEIGETFKAYDERAAAIQALPESHHVGPIQIVMENYKLALLVESNAWKFLLGKLLMAQYKEKLMEMIDFIKQQEKILARPIKDLDDCRLAMSCLEKIRENFIDMDMQLENMEAAYATFLQYKIDVPKEDIERIDNLRTNFTTMVNNSKNVQDQICNVQGPLQEELTAGVATFMQDVLDFDNDFEINGPMVPGLEAREASDRVLLFQVRFDDLWRRFEMYSSGERLFGLEVKDYPILHKRKKEFNLLQKLYSLYITVNQSIDAYFDIPWAEVDIEQIIAELTEFQNRCRKLPKGMKDWPAYLDLKKKIEDFNETCPLLELMANRAMKERHWQRMAKVCNYQFDIESPTFCLKDVMNAPLLKNKDDIEDICISAVKEKDIEAKLKQVIADWAVVELSFSTFKQRGELLLKGQETGDIIMVLEDSLMVMNSLLSNRYNAPFKKDIQLWVSKLVNTSEVLEKWMITQNLWIYLEAVFVGGDIARQLPQEAKRFQTIDKSWVRLMLRAHEIPNAVECCTADDTMMTMLPYLLEQLETCQKSLTGYLENKRLSFPRFFFISDPVLLEILGQSSDPKSIQPHLLSLFDAVYRVDFEPDRNDEIIGMRSDLNEVIPFEKSVHCTGGVELWLNSLLSTVKETVKGVIAAQAQCFKDPDYDFIKGFPTFCGQAGLLGVQLLWTKEAEYAIKKSKIDKHIMRNTNKRFLDLLNQLIELTTKDLTKLDRIRFETMVTIHVHQRDIFDDIVKLRVKNIMDFEWQKQARFYYFEETDDVTIKITDVIFDYQNEYLGVTERLVITPLTDRCYITLAQAIWMNMGGAPAGPAGTGKTETTKDMGRALGKLVVVFNCSDQMDFRGLGRIFKGLAQSGTWGCFDEFNRIELPVLSVAAQQIYIVLQARKERKPVFIFMDGDNVSMNIEFGIFLTMNPGYAGRQELPENLKIMFRSVAMMVPDRQIIIRVKLASCGFKENIVLSRKFFTLYKLCEEQLSMQVHYDFGLRNILSCLRTLGAQKRDHPTDTEETTVMRVLRDMNLSKLVDEDEPLFLSLIDDMFPGIKLTPHAYKSLQKAISNQVSQMGLINYPSWNLKIIQFYETSLVRHGLMSLGPTGAGKTSSMHVLMRALTECGRPHKELRMNPKAITAPQMFGKLDVATNDWTDGIFSTLWRRTLKVKKTDNIWLILDGPVDAVWIENLNSVLDDNKTLTLANGDRIVMAPNCKLIFEPDNVDNASPATVSRMGMTFLSSSVLPWLPILQAWLATRPQQEAETLKNFFNKIYGDMYTYVKVRLKPKMNILEALYIRQCYDLLQGIIDAALEDREKVLNDRHLEHLFLFACMWSLGAVLELDDRVKLEEYVLAHPSRMSWPKVKEDETIFEYMVNDNGRWSHWADHVEDFNYPTDQILEYASILVPNVDNVRTAFLIETIAKQNKAVLLIGEQGTAKTVMIKAFTNQFDPDFKLIKAFNFSYATTPNMVQRIIESYVDKRVGTTYGPPAGKSLTIFIDDINMPVINAWGDQVTNEIVRQLMEMQGFYSLDKPGDFSTILDVCFLAAMIHPGGGRNDIPNRLKRQFCIFNCTLPSNNSMDQIFSKIGTGYFCAERFKQAIVDFVPTLIPLTRHLWQKTKGKMLPTPAQFHYVFNLRDLSRIWQGITYITDAEVPNVTVLLQLWQHECSRVISDRFTNDNDRRWFLAMAQKQVEEEEIPDIMELYDPETTYFVDFLKDPPEATGDEPDDFDFSPPKIYQVIPSWEFVKERLFQFVEGYNEKVRGAAMDMVFFLDAMIHLCIISRVIRTPRGNIMLVGVGGSGKQSLTKLASYIANYSTFQILLTRSYNNSNLMDDLKILYRIAGAEGRGMTFIFTDNEIKEETFLEYLNNILSSGEIANLFAKDELDEIQSELIPVMKKVAPKRIPSNDNLYEFFISRARNNLHVVLCFSPVSEKFRSRALKFPGLISGVTIDWFSKWPMDALIEVGEHILGRYPIVCTADVKTELIVMTAVIQDYVNDVCSSYFDRYRRQTYVTPKTFLSFLDSYKVLYKTKHEDIEVMAVRMKTGLGKLVEAAASVDVLRKELAVKDKEILAATNEAEKVLNVVMEASEVANKIKEEATVVKERAEILVANISVDQQEAEGKLLAAKPALDAAEAALLTIKAADIATVRKLGKPPFLIMLIMDAVLLYFRKKVEPTIVDPEKKFLTTSWSESLKVMADTKFLQKLQEYPKDTINGEMLDLLEPYFEFPLYTFEAAKTACGNVAGLISWTIAMASFFRVNKDVLPLKANLARQQAKLDKAQTELKTAMALLSAKEAEVRECQEKYDNAMSLKQAVLDDANKVKSKMDAATNLINGLSGERIRWTEQSAQFKAETERLVGDVLVLTAFLGYAGPFNQEFRTNMQKDWYKFIMDHKIPLSSNLSIIDNLSDPATLGEWNLQGLPSDELSTQNGIIVTKATRFPLLIDPQNQGKLWIKNKEAGSELIVTALTHKYFRNHIEDAVTLGRPILIEDVNEELDPVLDNVLERNLIKIGTMYKVKLGDKEIDYMFGFRCYITTKLANPSYTPEIFARTSIIDFTVTMKGLEDQLLGRVILSEKKELETERTTLMKDVTANKRKIGELEKNLLYKLTTTQGNLVEDDSVLGVLNVTKNTATEVREKIATAHETEIKINLAREEYRPIATRGSVLYFLITTMAMVNCMYQTSLVQFLERFDVSMQRSEKSNIQQKRIHNIIEYLTYEIFKYKSRGLYECDKYMFVLMMALKIDIEKEYITHEEFQVFIKGGAALDLNACPQKTAKWIIDSTWLNLVELTKLRHYHNLVTQVQNNEKIWKSWFDKDSPEESPIPSGYHTLDVFRKLLLIRAWCPDRTLAQSKKYISSSLGAKFADPVVLNMTSMFEESRPLTPLICFLSTGSDPSPYIEQLAKRLELKVRSMSMGQGQEVHARKMMADAMENGYWALLQNTHLGLDYMEEVMLDFLEMEKRPHPTHPNYRLWITTEVHESFPIGLLQICIKFTNEPPSGIRAGLLRTYSSMNQDMLDYSDQAEYIPLVYAISFLHTVVQERRKFGPLGWNIPYEFNSADWLASCMFIQNHLDDLDPIIGISWPTIRYMIGEVQYGGRVTDDFDKRLLNTFAKVWFSDRMFAEEFQFYKGYKIYKFKQLNDYMGMIESFPGYDPPQAYGLHPNAEITYSSNTTNNILQTVLSIQPKESAAGGGETREDKVERICYDMLAKIPVYYDQFEVKERLKIMGHLNPLNIFLRQEIDRMQKIIALVKVTLNELILAIEGTIIMNDDLRNALDNIFDARVPAIWLRYSWSATSIGFWFTEFLDRDAQFRGWCFGGRPTAFWMMGFFNPQGFLTAMRQEVARAHKGWALDAVVLHNEVSKYAREEVKQAPPEGVFVYGLFLDGAGWERKHSRLTESTNKVLYTPLPVVHIFAIFTTSPKDPKLYVCPVYKKARRTDLNFITPLWLCTMRPPEHWILRGVALLCDTS